MMQVKLRVLHGPNAGEEIAVVGPEFAIGRRNGCHLFPKSKAVSRRHCAILVGGDQVTVMDLGSRNGTFVNGQRVNGERVLETGDVLRIGPLEFELLIPHRATAPRESNPTDDADYVTRRRSAVDEADISDWLTEGAETNHPPKPPAPETSQFKTAQSDLDEGDNTSQLG